MKTIYHDDDRELLVENGVLKTPQNTNINISLMEASVAPRLPASSIAAVKRAGKNPADYFALMAYGRVAGVFPAATRVAIEEAIADRKAEVEAARRDPAKIARRAVSQLFDRAEALIDYPGEYYPAIREAEAALAAWRADYPSAARAEKKQDLKVKAEALKEKAAGALVYDADGMLSAEDQDRRYADLMAQAAALEAEADTL